MSQYPFNPDLGPEADQSVELRKENEREYFKQLAVALAVSAFAPAGATLCLECSTKFTGEGSMGYCKACAYRVFREED